MRFVIHNSVEELERGDKYCPKVIDSTKIRVEIKGRDLSLDIRLNEKTGQVELTLNSNLAGYNLVVMPNCSNVVSVGPMKTEG